MEENSSQTIDELLDTLNQVCSTIHEYFQEIGKLRRAGVFAPHDLSVVNKAKRSITCILRHNTEAIFDRLSTGNEKLVFYDNQKRKRQWLPPNESPRSQVYFQTDDFYKTKYKQTMINHSKVVLE